MKSFGSSSSDDTVDAPAASPLLRPDPFRCGDESNVGVPCDLQPGHGGTMHSGVFLGVVDATRVWWDRESGDLTAYSRRAVERVR